MYYKYVVCKTTNIPDKMTQFFKYKHKIQLKDKNNINSQKFVEI